MSPAAGQNHLQSHSMPSKRLLAVVLFAASLSACATSRGAMSPAAADRSARSGPRDEIARLWTEIETWTNHGQRPVTLESADSVPEPMSADAGPQPRSSSKAHRPPVTTRPLAAAAAAAAPVACTEGVDLDQEPLCTDVCTLATAICDNAQAICRIARELNEDNDEDDQWAQGTCRRAEASCSQATERCCACKSGDLSEP